MAILKQRLNHKNSNGSRDTVYLETSSDLVIRPDGTTVEHSLSDVKATVTSIINNGSPAKAHAASHSSTGSDRITPSSIGAAASDHQHSNYAVTNHGHNYAGSSSDGGSATSAVKLQTARTIRTNLGSSTAATFNGTENITPGVTGVLSAANGGTGVTSISALKAALDIGSPTITAPAYPGSIPAVGNTMSWAGKTWRVVHKMTGIAILALEYWEEGAPRQANGGQNHSFYGSSLWCKCMEFSNRLNLFAAAYIINFSGLPCFIPSLDQIHPSDIYETPQPSIWKTYEQYPYNFDYFDTTNDQVRIFKDKAGNKKRWWIASVTPAGYSDADASYFLYVEQNGEISHTQAVGAAGEESDKITAIDGEDPMIAGRSWYCSPWMYFGFRPFVAIRL